MKPPLPRRINRTVLVCVALLLGGLFWANARFVQLAFESQPECVAHDKGGTDDDGRFRAAKSSC